MRSARSPDKKVNIDGLRMTLSALQEEKRSLETQLKNGNQKKVDDVRFDLEVVSKNIQHVQDKINAATN